MRKEAKLLLEKSLDSLILSIEHFNRPWDRGREEAVLIMLDRAFELFLKSIIIHKGGKIREAKAKETIGFDKCVRKCLSDENLKCLNDEEALTVQIVNSLRDAAQHYLLDISESQLYMYCQAAISLYNKMLTEIFETSLQAKMPERILPVSTNPPKDLIALFDSEIEEIKKFAAPRSRKKLQARAKVRSLAIVEASLRGERSQPSKSELDKAVRSIGEGADWKHIFPGVASLRLDTEGSGLSVSIRLTKKDGEAVHLVPEGTPGSTIVAVKKVNELDFYNMGLNMLATHLKITAPKTLALIDRYKIQESEDCFKTIRIGKTQHKRYSRKALELLRQHVQEISIDDVWRDYKQRRSAAKRAK